MARSGRGRKGRSSCAPGVTAGRSSRAPFTPAELDAIQARATLPKKARPVPDERSESVIGRAWVAGNEPGSPLTNRGGTVTQTWQGGRGVPSEPGRLVLTDSGVKFVPVSRPVGEEKVSIDYASLTVSEHVLVRVAPDLKPVTDDCYVEAFAAFVQRDLLCLPFSLVILKAGMFGYARAAKLGDYGIVAAGGNGNTLFLSFSGHAFACADDRFCYRLSEFIRSSETAHLTRVDLAFDDFAGEIFPVRSILDCWEQGGFDSSTGGRRSKLEKRGDWERGDPDRSGLTVYIGSRSSGRLFRFYEKGRQLGDKQSPWVRAEIELRNSAFHLVPEILTRPTGFFIGSAPMLSQIEYAMVPAKLERVAKEGLMTVEAIVRTIQTQYGGHLEVLRQEFFGSDQELLNAVCRIPKVIPAGLRRSLDLSNSLESVVQESGFQAQHEKDES